jgi:RHS repeat-associated protein
VEFWPLNTECFLPDALGSVRQLVAANGALTLAQAYQPYGETLNSAGDGASHYAFAGEWRDASGLDYLRARYYAPWQGRFLTKDAWEGDYARPLTLNRWNYVVSNPVNLTDPTGMFPEYCSMFPNRMLYEDCVRDYYNVERPWGYGQYLVGRMEPQGCGYPGPIPYSTVGFIAGVSTLAVAYSAGVESVFDLATMQEAGFAYHGVVVSSGWGVGFSLYAGMVGVAGFNGFNSNSYGEKYKERGIHEYEGTTITINAGVQIGPGNAGAIAFRGANPPFVGGVAGYVGGSLGVEAPFGPEIGLGVTNYVLVNSTLEDYGYQDNGYYRVRKSELIQAFSAAADFGTRGLLNLIEAYEALYNAGKQ